MRLEAVTVCDQYSDFLAWTLPLNKPQFDRLVVVTSPEDHATQQICDFHDVELVKTDQLRSRWGDWNKAKGINAGLRFLRQDGWVLHLDADIALPPRARVLMDRKVLDRQMLYGVDRLRVADYERWIDFLTMPHIQTDGYHVRLEDSFPMMSRFNAWHLNGFAPPGYFQLWHPSVSGISNYPDDHNGGDRTDVMFAENWKPEKRQLIPEFAAYHLESELHVQGANWGGRTTKHFGPEPSRRPNDYAHRLQPHHKHHADTAGSNPGGRRDPPICTSKPQVVLQASYGPHPVVGEPLTADPGQWSGQEPITLVTGWWRKHGSAEELIMFDSASYVVQAGDVGYQLFLRVNATNPLGSSTADSTDTPPVQ
jgi:hypothetical protein